MKTAIKFARQSATALLALCLFAGSYVAIVSFIGGQASAQYTPPSGGGGSLPAGSAGCVQLYATSSTFGCGGAYVDTTISRFGFNTTQKLSAWSVVSPADTVASGTTTANATTSIVGIGTSFLTQMGVGDFVSLSSAPTVYAPVLTITDNTHFTVTEDIALGNGSSQTINVKHGQMRLVGADGLQGLAVGPNGDMNLGAIGGVDTQLYQPGANTYYFPTGFAVQHIVTTEPFYAALSSNVFHANPSDGVEADGFVNQLYVLDGAGSVNRAFGEYSTAENDNTRAGKAVAILAASWGQVFTATGSTTGVAAAFYADVPGCSGTQTTACAGFFNANQGLGNFAWYSEGGTNHLETGNALNVGVEIEAFPSQSADLFRTLASDGITVNPFRVLADGSTVFGGGSASLPVCWAADGKTLSYVTAVSGCASSFSLTGTTGSIGGGLLTIGTCTSGTASITGATTSMGIAVTPVAYPGDGIWWEAYVSGSNTVTVKVCATATLTPSATTYNVRVIQ